MRRSDVGFVSLAPFISDAKFAKHRQVQSGNKHLRATMNEREMDDFAMKTTRKKFVFADLLAGKWFF